jgi:hypothetical protein
MIRIGVTGGAQHLDDPDRRPARPLPSAPFGCARRAFGCVRGDDHDPVSVRGAPGVALSEPELGHAEAGEGHQSKSLASLISV